jgi:hypothetical protein
LILSADGVCLGVSVMDPVIVAKRLEAAADCLSGLSFDLVDSSDLAGLRTALNRVRGSVQITEARFVTRVAALADQGRAPDPEDEQKRGARSSSREAKRTTRNAEVLHRFPALAAALEAGRVSMDHIDAVAVIWSCANDAARSALEADDQELARLASRLSVVEFAAHLRRQREAERRDSGETRELRERRANRAFSDWNPMTGRYELRVNLNAARGKALETAIETEIDRMIRDDDLADTHPDLRSDRGHLRAYAIANLASKGFQIDAPTVSLGARTELCVLIDAETLRIGEHTGTVCETVDGIPIPVSLARRLACEAAVIPIVMGSTGEVLDLGRTTRLANRAQRRSCAAMYRTCAAPGCEVGFDRCEIHHLHWWEHGGPTDMSNLVPLCGRHHHLIHDAGFTATLTANRTLRWYRPDGTLDADQPLRPRASQPATTSSSGMGSGQGGHAPPGNTDSPPGRPAAAPPGDTGNGAGEQLILVA